MIERNERLNAEEMRMVMVLDEGAHMNNVPRDVVVLEFPVALSDGVRALIERTVAAKFQKGATT